MWNLFYFCCFSFHSLKKSMSKVIIGHFFVDVIKQLIYRYMGMHKLCGEIKFLDSKSFKNTKNNFKGFFYYFMKKIKFEIQFFHTVTVWISNTACDTLVYYGLKNVNFIWRSRQYAYVKKYKIKCKKYFQYMIWILIW
jgi:hypothetical protein